MLTDETKSDLAIENFEWFQQTVKRRYGPQMEEHAGPAFMRVLSQFDPDKGSFRAFAGGGAMDYALKAEYAEDHGRAGSKRREAEKNKRSSDDIESEDESATSGDSLVGLLRQIDAAQMNLATKSIAVCQVLGLFDDGDTAFIVGRRSLRGAILRPTNT